MNPNHPISDLPKARYPHSDDHHGWLEYWTHEMLRSIQRYVAGGEHEHLDYEHIGRSAKRAMGHARKLLRYRDRD